MKRRTTVIVGLVVMVTASAAVLARRARRAREAAIPVGADAAPPSEARPPLPPTRASVRVFDEGRPMPDRWVVFHTAEGEVLEAVKTGPDGRAEGHVGPHGMVTIAHGTSMKELQTFTDVMPGDELTLGEDEDEGGPGKTICRAQVTTPEKPRGAARVVVNLGLGTTEVNEAKRALSLSVLERFLVDGRFGVLAEALDENGSSLAYAHGTFAGCRADAGTVEARLGPWTKDYRVFRVDVSAARASLGEGAKLTASLAIVGAETDVIDRGAPVAPSAGLFEFRAPRPLGDRAALVVVAERGPSRARFEDRRPSMPEEVALGADDLALSVSDVTLEREGVRARVGFRAAARRDALDALIVELAWPATREHAWTLVAPPDRAAPLTTPALPDALAAWRPDPTAAMSARVTLRDASIFAGYADVRRRGLAAFAEGSDEERVVVRSASSEAAPGR